MEISVAILVVVLLLIAAVGFYAYTSRNAHIVVVLAFFLSGSSGLVLESLWTRMLRHVFGSTTLAISTVLTAFMGGLALGSFLFGRYADRIKKPLLVYAAAEGVVGIYALIVPFLVQDLFPYINLWMWENFEANYSTLSVLRFAFSAAALILPSTMMGATLPLLARHFVSRPEGMKRVGLSVGILYTLNTMGAIAGTFVAGFVLLPEVGQMATNTVAAVINLSLCGAIFALRKPLTAPPKPDEQSYTEKPGFLSVLVGIFILAFAVAAIVACWGFGEAWFILFILLLILVGGMLVFRGALQGVESKREGAMPNAPPVQMYPISNAARIAALVTFFFSGVASMNYQVIWSRAMAMVIGSSVYSFTIILLAFLVGIAIGSAAYSSWMHRVRNPVLHLACVKLFVGLMAMLNFLILDNLPFYFARLVVRNVEHYHQHIGTVQFFMFLVVALAIIPVTIGMGAGFPLTIKIATSGHGRLGRDVGSIYAINTVGCIIGSFCAAFVFVPQLSAFTYYYGDLVRFVSCIFGIGDSCSPLFSHGNGLQYAVYLSLMMNFAMAVTLVVLSPKRRELIPLKYVMAPLIPIWFIGFVWQAPEWNLAHMTLGTFRLSLGEDATDPERLAEPDLVFYFDGMSTTVSVERWGRHLALKNNGKVDASNGEDMSTQIMVTGFPFLFHPEGPEDLDVAVIGFGSGTSLGSAVQFPVERVDIIELEPSISGPPVGVGDTDEERIRYRRERAGARWFLEINHDPWSDPRVNIINNDGRNYLASTSRRYDVVISEPSNPWITGVSDLFTVDHFRAASQALAPHGIFCQWVQLYELSPENIQAVFRAIAGAFPYMVVFAAEDLSSDTVILASYDPIPLDVARVRRAMETPAARREMERAGVYTPFDAMARTIFASREEVLAYSSLPLRDGRCPFVDIDNNRERDSMEEWTEDQSRYHEGPIGRHHRGVCVGGAGQCDTDADCEGEGIRCHSAPLMGVCQDALRTCITDADCHEGVRCQYCAVELNTDDNSRIEFNAPRDLIGYERFERYVSTFYSPDWPYGHLCTDPSDPERCHLANFGEGDEGAGNYADLAISMMGNGKIAQARRFIEIASEMGGSNHPRTEMAAAVFQYLMSDDHEPVPRFGPPVPAPQMDDATRQLVADQYRNVMRAVEQQHWPMALQSLQQIPATVRRASGPDMTFLQAYLIYKVGPQAAGQSYRDGIRLLAELVRLEEEYVRAHPEVNYFLARYYKNDYSFDRARRFMVAYVEGITGADQPEEDESSGGVSDAEGLAPKDVHPDYGTPRTVEEPPEEEDEGEQNQPQASTDEEASD